MSVRCVCAASVPIGQIGTDAALLQRSIVDLNQDRLYGLVGVYDVDGIADQPVVLRVLQRNDHLITSGVGSDGELFPMHESKLTALSDTRFCWLDWPMELEFVRDDEGIAHGLYIHTPPNDGRYHGVRRAR